jgi:hypothetical protein
MNKICILAIVASMARAALAADASTVDTSAAVPATSASAPVAPVSASTMPNGDFCLYAGSPPSDITYRGLGRVKLGKGTYGGVRDELPSFVEEARARGADAITNYNGAQRFGFWPWRMVRPVLTGIAVKFDAGKVPDCAKTGGSTLATIMATNIEPARR